MDATQLEEWCPVIGEEGRYEVSSHGRVRSLTRFVPGRQGVVQGRVLKPRPTPTGYLRVGIARRDRYIHHLVLEAFVGPCPDGMECCHNNGDRGDNRPSNLRWDTRLGNCQDIIAQGTHSQSQKTHCPRGHEYDAVCKSGWVSKAAGPRPKRYCRTCHNARNRAAYAAKKRAA